MPLFISNEELSLISHDAVAIAEKADAYIRQLKAELAEVQEHNHKLRLQSIEKDEEISELRKSKRQLIELVEEKELVISEKDTTLKSYIDKIGLESTTITTIQNTPKCQGMISGRDRISELPNTIICEILSRLPTKVAVATTILSKRWHDQWTYCFNLDFSDLYFEYDPIFPTSQDHEYEDDEVIKISFVNVKQVIALNKSSCINKFQLKNARMDESYVTACLDLILRRNVVEIELDVCLDEYRDDRFTLPESLFTCQTLVFLDLTSRTAYDFPPSVHLPSLKVFRVDLYDPSVVVTTTLFRSLPVLEDLSVSIYEDDKENMTLNIFTPSLKRLELDLCRVSDYRIVVRAPSLKELDIFDDMIANYVFEELPLHVKARLLVGNCNSKLNFMDEQFAAHAIQLMNGISGVQSLALSSCIYWTQDIGNVVVFPNVTCLEVDVNRCCGFTYLPNLIDRLPNLTFLVLKMVPEHIGHVPQRLLLHLKRIIVKSFSEEYKLKSLEDLLKVAEVLDEVAALILENTFTSILDMAGVLLPFLKWFIGSPGSKGPKVLNFLVRSPWNTLEIVGQIKQPILFLSGLQDAMVPPSHMQMLYAKAAAHNRQCIFEAFPTGMHMDTWLAGGDHHWKTIQQYFELHVPEKTENESSSNDKDCETR